MEVGPWVMDQNGGLHTREGGWEEYTHIVYSAYLHSYQIRPLISLFAVDQPAGTGFSYTSTNRYVHELSEVGGIY